MIDGEVKRRRLLVLFMPDPHVPSDLSQEADSGGETGDSLGILGGENLASPRVATNYLICCPPNVGESLRHAGVYPGEDAGRWAGVER